MNKTLNFINQINKEEHDKINAEGHDSAKQACPDMKIGLKKDIQVWQKMPIKVTLSCSNITAKDLKMAL